MKIGIIGDVHWCQYSSILRSRGNEYSTRLENCINSINWAEEYLKDKIDLVVYLGDFFDQPKLNAEEISALTKLNFCNVPHIIIVGNHEMGINTLEYSSSHLFDLLSNFRVISEPETIEKENIQLCFLPYTLDADKTFLEDVFNQTDKTRIIFSHNDIAGIQMGSFISKTGLKIDDIEKSCRWFINGHIHNGQHITDKILNLGNLTGQNFSEDANKYRHHIGILDTETCEIQLVENPNALNFYHMDYTCFPLQASTNPNFSNAVISVKCFNKDVDEVKKIINDLFPVASRITVEYEKQEHIDTTQELSLNHIQEFEKYVKEYIGNDEMILSELAEVLK